MRILFISNFYPPHETGGLGLECKEVVDELGRRGHQVAVLTSMHGTKNIPTREGEVHRRLYLEMDLASWSNAVSLLALRGRRTRHNQQACESILTAFKPDLVFIWGLWNLSPALAVLAEALLPGRVVYRLADYWPTLPSQAELYWREPGRTFITRLARRVLNPVALALLRRDVDQFQPRFEHAVCVSRATRDRLAEAGIPVAGARVVHGGFDIEPFLTSAGLPPRDRAVCRALYLGRLSPEKGVETVIEALAELVHRRGRSNVQLELIGSGHVSYERRLRMLVQERDLTSRVFFAGQVPKSAVPALLQSGDILVVPSLWPEPLGRVVREGMVSGLAVVAAAAGGIGEIVEHRKNGLLFAPGDVQALTDNLVELMDDAELGRQLAKTARANVIAELADRTWINDIEQYLQEVAASTHNEYAAVP